MNIYSPYTYLIGWTREGKYYYGVRYAKNCTPSDFWTCYFTSSKEVSKYRDVYGEPDIKQVRKTFDTASAARLWEQKVIRRLEAVKSDKWLNKGNSGAEFYNAGYIPSPELMEKRRQSNIGKKRSAETKAKIGIANSKKTRSEEVRSRISNTLKGRKIPQDIVLKREKTKNEKGRVKPNLGKPIPDHVKAKISASLLGRKRPPEVIAKIKEGIALRKQKKTTNPELA